MTAHKKGALQYEESYEKGVYCDGNAGQNSSGRKLDTCCPFWDRNHSKTGIQELPAQASVYHFCSCRRREDRTSIHNWLSGGNSSFKESVTAVVDACGSNYQEAAVCARRKSISHSKVSQNLSHNERRRNQNPMRYLYANLGWWTRGKNVLYLSPSMKTGWSHERKSTQW